MKVVYYYMSKINLQSSFRAVIILLMMTVSMASITTANGTSIRQADSSHKSSVFSGAWFDVRFPADFCTKPSMKSSTAEGYDSAEFISPDGTVSFYVFAPQWGGNASDIALVPEHEQLVAEQRRQLRNREIRWITIAARDGSYRRSYQDTFARQGSVRTIVGIKYRSEEDRLRYLKAYELFRRSLKLYAD